MELTKNQIEILDHAAHRTANGLFCGDSADMQVLVGSGLMMRRGKKSFCPDEYFSLTRAGRQTLKGETK